MVDAVTEPQDDDEHAQAPPHPPPESKEEPESKRNKRDWLAFHGTRRTRVGDDFQVAALPTPGSNSSNNAEDDAAPRVSTESGDVNNDSTGKERGVAVAGTSGEEEAKEEKDGDGVDPSATGKSGGENQSAGAPSQE
jgi:hypothetical protein